MLFDMGMRKERSRPGEKVVWTIIEGKKALFAELCIMCNRDSVEEQLRGYRRSR